MEYRCLGVGMSEYRCMAAGTLWEMGEQELVSYGIQVYGR